MTSIPIRATAIAVASLALAGCNMNSRDFKGLTVAATGSYWRSEVKGDVKAGGPSPSGANRKVDVRRDMGVDDNDQWTGRLDVALDKHRIGVEYLPLQFSGSDPNDQPFVFQGQTYPAGDGITSDLDLKTWVGRWDYAVSQSRKKADAVHVGLDAWWWSFDAHVRGNPSGNDERRSYTKLYPGFHTDTTLEMSKQFTADFNVALAGLDLDRFIYDLGASASYRISDVMSLGAGYRWLRFDVDEGNDRVDLTVRGPYAVFTLRF